MADLDVPKFERLCRQSGLIPLSRASHKLGDVFIAEGPVSAEFVDGIFNPPHWCVLWAVQHRGIDVAQRFPMAWESSQRERMLEAMKRAHDYLEQYATVH